MQWDPDHTFFVCFLQADRMNANILALINLEQEISNCLQLNLTRNERNAACVVSVLTEILRDQQSTVSESDHYCICGLWSVQCQFHGVISGRGTSGVLLRCLLIIIFILTVVWCVVWCGVVSSVQVWRPVPPSLSLSHSHSSLNNCNIS